MPNTRKVNGKTLSGDITLDAGSVGAFSRGATATVQGENGVPWNAVSGSYITSRSGDSLLVVHFNVDSGSTPALQLRTQYKNNGIAYRSARDRFGFEESWTEFYTTKNKPSAVDVGALPITGGSLSGQISSSVMDNYRIEAGGYGVFLRLDGSDFYILQTNKNDSKGSWNGFRPFSINMETGKVLLGHETRINGDLLIGGTGTRIATDGNIWGSRWGNKWLWDAIIEQVNGRATWDYVNSTFVQDIRLGTVEHAQLWRGVGYTDTPPYVITGISNYNRDEFPDTTYRRPIQKLINGVWHNIGAL
ncbi:phage tail fiber protein [Xenorhabdus sp. Sc-CR9]|uniref:phage tail fiber protein n=1 Tax=Xenorhabdus sp. Sc-CR9 TaxID=2584468 RepID=UPI001F35D45C